MLAITSNLIQIRNLRSKIFMQIYNNNAEMLLTH